jgi:hypothetical protein
MDMDLTFIDQNGNSEVIASSDSLEELKKVVRNHYQGDDLLIWQSGPTGKPHGENILDSAPCVCRLTDGATYKIE